MSNIIMSFLVTFGILFGAVAILVTFLALLTYAPALVLGAIAVLIFVALWQLVYEAHFTDKY